MHRIESLFPVWWAGQNSRREDFSGGQFVVTRVSVFQEQRWKIAGPESGGFPMGWSDLGKKPLLFFRSGAEKLPEASEKWESSQALGSPPPQSQESL